MKITITFKLDHDVFKHADGTLNHDQVAAVVEDIQHDISSGETKGFARDTYGNSVGNWEITRD